MGCARSSHGRILESNLACGDNRFETLRMKAFSAARVEPKVLPDMSTAKETAALRKAWWFTLGFLGLTSGVDGLGGGAALALFIVASAYFVRDAGLCREIRQLWVMLLTYRIEILMGRMRREAEVEGNDRAACKRH